MTGLALLTAAVLQAGATPDATVLLQKMAAAEKENRQQALFFVYREDIRHSETKPGGEPRMLDWNTYEVMFLAGEPYHRHVAAGGVPLSPAAAEAEERRFREVEKFRRETPYEERRRRYFAAEENRFKIDTRLVVEHHTTRFVGEDTVEGRKTWVIETTPKHGAPKPKRRSEWSLSQRIKYWIDQRTFVPLKLESVQLFDFNGVVKGAETCVEYVEVGGVWLTANIRSVSHRTSGGARIEGETNQSYSNYRRFRADSVLLFEKD